MIELGLLGAEGKMGTHLKDLLKKSSDARVQGIQLTYEPNRATFSTQKTKKIPDVIIDFSSPEFLLQNLEIFTKNGKKTRWLVGSTGWSKDELSRLDLFNSSQLLLKAANFSLGVLFLKKALKHVEADLRKAGFEAAITETHHVRKKDAPSGTAILLREVLKSYPNLPIESVREGGVVGFHQISFDTGREKLIFSHEAKDRALFAEGAGYCVRPFASWSLQKSGRIYELEDLFS